MKYVLPSIFIFVAIMMGCNRFANYGKPLEAFNITAPPYRNAVEQLLALQEAIIELEALIQAGNVVLLKVRALVFAALPQVLTHKDLIIIKPSIIFLLKYACHKIQNFHGIKMQ